LGQHGGMVGRGHLGTDGPGDHRADLLDDVEELLPGLGDERGVGGDAVEKSGGGELTDFPQVGGIDEELHGGPAPLRIRALAQLTLTPALSIAEQWEGEGGVPPPPVSGYYCSQ